jgi:hypothetical protein
MDVDIEDWNMLTKAAEDRDAWKARVAVLKAAAQRSTKPKPPGRRPAYKNRNNAPKERFTFFPSATAQPTASAKATTSTTTTTTTKRATKKLSNVAARAAYYERLTNKTAGHETRQQVSTRAGHDNSKTTKTTIKPTWDLAAAEIFSSSCSGSYSSWYNSYNGDSHNGDSHIYNDSRTDFLPQHNSAVFCRNHTPPSKATRKQTSANSIWAEPVPSCMLPTPSPSTTHSTHHTTPTHNTSASSLWAEPVPLHMLPTPSPTHTTPDITLNSHAPAFIPHTNPRKHFIHLKYLQKKHTQVNPPTPTPTTTDTHMNDTLPLNEYMNETDTHTHTTTFFPHMCDLSPIQSTPQTPSLHTIPLSPISLHSPKNIITTNTTTNNNHNNNIEIDFPEKTLLF